MLGEDFKLALDLTFRHHITDPPYPAEKPKQTKGYPDRIFSTRVTVVKIYSRAMPPPTLSGQWWWVEDLLNPGHMSKCCDDMLIKQLSEMEVVAHAALSSG